MGELSLYEQELRLDIEHLLGGVVNLPFELPPMPARLADAFDDRWPSGCGVENFARLLRVETPEWMYSIWEKVRELTGSEAEQAAEALCGLKCFWSFAEAFDIVKEQNAQLGPAELKKEAMASLWLD